MQTKKVMGRKRKVSEISLSLELQKQLVRSYKKQQEKIFQLKSIIRQQKEIIARYSKPAALGPEDASERK